MAVTPSGEAVGPTRLALVFGIVLAAQDNTNRPLGVVILLGLAVLLGLSLRWDLGPLVIAGTRRGRGGDAPGPPAQRHVRCPDRHPLGHRNGHGGRQPLWHRLRHVLAPGAPFPYGPLALAWYVPFQGDPRLVETAVSFLDPGPACGARAAARPGRVRAGAAPDPHRQRWLQRHERRAPPAGGARRPAAQPARRRGAAGPGDRVQAVCRRLVHPARLVGAGGRDSSASWR